MSLSQSRYFRVLTCICIGLCTLLETYSTALAAQPRTLSEQSPNAARSTSSQLASDVREIADSSALARARKEKLISATVRSAVMGAIQQVRDPEKVLGAVLDLTTAAASSAPEFTETIILAASFLGPVAQIEGARLRIRSAAFAAARTTPSRVNPSTGSPPRTSGATQRIASDDPAMRVSSGTPAEKVSLSKNSNVVLTAEVAVTHDSNIFLKPQDEVSETVRSFTPRATFRFGQNSRAHGGVSYKVAFTDYANNSAPTSRLGTGTADFGYDDGRLSIDAGLSHQQVTDNTRDVAALSGNTLIRRDIFDATSNFETAVTAKTTVQGGVDVDWTKYKRSGLVGSKNITVPLRVYVQTTPKLAVSTGISFGKVKPQGGGPDGKDLFYNIGLRGNFTERLSTNISAGYRTRTVADNPSEGLWSFNGGFNYDFSSKTSMALAMSRGFDVGVSGESVKSTRYFLSFSSVPSMHWQFAGSVGYSGIDYGADVFANKATVFSSGRADSSWESSLTATYVFNRWLSSSATWTNRENSSNAAAAEFSDSILGVSLVFQY